MLFFIFCIIIFGSVQSQSYTSRSDVTTSNLMSFEGKKGSWSKWQYCAPNSWATGFKLKVEASQGVADDTGANGIKLQCTSNRGIINEVTNKEGKWGKWSYSWATCPDSTRADRFMTAISTKVDMVTKGGYTGLNSVKAQCSSNYEITVDNPGDDGSWGNWAVCPRNSKVCGFQTKVQKDQGMLSDDSALNAVQFACCSYSAKQKVSFWEKHGNKFQTLFLIVIVLLVAVNLSLNLHRFYSPPRKDLTINNTMDNEKYISVDVGTAVDEVEVDADDKDQLIQSL